MRLTPTEQDRLLLFTAAELARTRLERGLLVDVTEATALVADAVAEAARDGCRLAEAVEAGRGVLTREELLPGVAETVTEVTVEAAFADGTTAAVVTEPFGPAPEPAVGPGAELVDVTVTNTAEVPISVTSHVHFFEVNPRLRFDRAAAYGRHLARPAGTSMWFEPGATETVSLTPIGGDRVAVGFAGLVEGALDAPGARAAALHRARACGYLDSGPVA